MDIVTLIGVIGALIILVAFLLNQFSVWSRDSFAYDAANMIGSGLLFWYAYLLGSLPFLVLNGVWLMVSLRDVLLYFRRRE